MLVAMRSLADDRVTIRTLNFEKIFLAGCQEPLEEKASKTKTLDLRREIRKLRPDLSMNELEKFSKTGLNKKAGLADEDSIAKAWRDFATQEEEAEEAAGK